MRNIFLGLAFVLVFLPKVSMAATTPLVTSPSTIANPQAIACNQQIDANAKIFFQKQGQERGVFIAANQALIAKQDAHGKWMMLHKNDKNPATPVPPDLSSQEAALFSAFVAQQQAEKVAFFQQQIQARQACMNGSTTSST